MVGKLVSVSVVNNILKNNRWLEKRGERREEERRRREEERRRREEERWGEEGGSMKERFVPN